MGLAKARQQDMCDGKDKRIRAIEHLHKKRTEYRANPGRIRIPSKIASVLQKNQIIYVKVLDKVNGGMLVTPYGLDNRFFVSYEIFIEAKLCENLMKKETKYIQIGDFFEMTVHEMGSSGKRSRVTFLRNRMTLSQVEHIVRLVTEGPVLSLEMKPHAPGPSGAQVFGAEMLAREMYLRKYWG